MLIGIRTLVDPTNPADLKAAHALAGCNQGRAAGGPGKFEVPNWDPASQKKVRDALIVLSTTLTDTSHAFGTKDEVDPIHRLISAAATWGGNPPKDATYLNFTPPKNDGKTVYKLTVKDVPVDGFWSISLYNDEGLLSRRTTQNAYSLNNITAKKSADGSYTDSVRRMRRQDTSTACRSCPAGTTPCASTARERKFSTAPGSFRRRSRPSDKESHYHEQEEDLDVGEEFGRPVGPVL